jgi:hypothetical protein
MNVYELDHLAISHQPSAISHQPSARKSLIATGCISQNPAVLTYLTSRRNAAHEDICNKTGRPIGLPVSRVSFNPKHLAQRLSKAPSCLDVRCRIAAQHSKQRILLSAKYFGTSGNTYSISHRVRRLWS